MVSGTNQTSVRAFFGRAKTGANFPHQMLNSRRRLERAPLVKCTEGWCRLTDNVNPVQ